MQSGVFYSQVLLLLIPCSLLASAAVWALEDAYSALFMLIGSVTVGLLRLAATLSLSRFGSHSVGINGLYALAHLLTLGVSIPSASSVFCSLAIFLNSTNSRLSWLPAPPVALGVLSTEKLLGCVLTAFLSGFLPTLSIFPFIFCSALEIQSAVLRAYLLSRSVTACIPTRPERPLGRGEPLRVWLELYSAAASQAELGWLPALAPDAPEELKLLVTRLSCSDLSARLTLLLALSETRSAAGLAAERELRTLRERHSERKLLDVAGDPDRLRLRLQA